MDLLRRLLGLKAPEKTPAPKPSAQSRVDMPLHGSPEDADIVSGWRYCATLQLRTPAYVLRRHGEFAPLSPSGPPEVSREMWHGIWVPELKDPFLELSAGRTMASEVGPIPVDGGDYLPFLLALREVVESDQPIEQKAEALRALSRQRGPGGTPFSRYLSTDALLERVLPLAVTQLPVPVSVARTLHAAGFTRLRDVDAASDADLLALKGVGPKSVSAIRSFLATTDVDRDAERCLARELAEPRR